MKERKRDEGREGRSVGNPQVVLLLFVCLVGWFGLVC